MNIQDVKPVKVPEGVPLRDIFESQLKLMANYHDIEEESLGRELPKYPVNLDSYKGQERLKDLAFRVISEIIEATECLKNKPWKITAMETDVDHFYEEISDAFHFFIEFCITAGLTSSDLYELYFRKHDVNKFRQRSQY